MKRERNPPKTWRRNMLTGAAFLAVLDGVILSPGPDAVRDIIALALTLFVGGFITWVWVTNTRIERTREQR